MANYRRLGSDEPLRSCCTRSALGGADAGPTIASLVSGGERAPLSQVFLMSVAAGLSVFVLSRLIDPKGK